MIDPLRSLGSPAEGDIRNGPIALVDVHFELTAARNDDERSMWLSRLIAEICVPERRPVIPLVLHLDDRTPDRSWVKTNAGLNGQKYRHSCLRVFYKRAGEKAR